MPERHGMDNRALAEMFDQIGDLLEIKGEVVYKVLAYRRAARVDPQSEPGRRGPVAGG